MNNKLKKQQLTKREAQRRTAQHKKDFAGLRKGWVRLGAEVAESVDLGVPAKLGKTMRQWLDETFAESASHIFRELQSYRALKGVPQQTLERMPEANAHQLTRLPEKDRKAPEIVSKAVSQAPKEFKETVDGIREAKYGITPELWKTHAVRVPAVVDALIVLAEEKMARVLQLDIEDDTVRCKNLIVIWECIAQLVNDTPEEWLVIETTGGGPLEEIAIRRGGMSNLPSSAAKSGTTSTQTPT